MAVASVQFPLEDVVAGMDHGPQCPSGNGRFYLPVSPRSCATEACNVAACGAEAISGASSGSQAPTSAFLALQTIGSPANKPACCAPGSSKSPTASPASTRAPSPEPPQKLNLRTQFRWADLEDSPTGCQETNPRCQFTGVGSGSSGSEARTKFRWADIMELGSDAGDPWESGAVSQLRAQREANLDVEFDDSQGKWRTDKRSNVGRSRVATDRWRSHAWRTEGTDWSQRGHHKSWKAAGNPWSSWRSAGTAWGDAWSAAWDYGSARATTEDLPKRGRKWQCQFQVGIEEEPTFRVVRRLLGPAGQNMKDIAAQTGAKLRLRGRGSKFLEGPEQIESAEPLMLCISVEGQDSYIEAIDRVTKLLEGIYSDYTEFCALTGKSAPQLWVTMHEGPREGSR